MQEVSGSIPLSSTECKVLPRRNLRLPEKSVRQTRLPPFCHTSPVRIDALSLLGGVSVSRPVAKPHLSLHKRTGQARSESRG
jgi:hypothetical protein